VKNAPQPLEDQDVQRAGGPDFLAGLPLAQAAWAYAEEMHRGQTRKFDGAPFMDHPREVAALLHEAGAPERVVAAGLLHDTVERTDATLPDLARRFGNDVAGLVAAVTEDPTIGAYRQRKAALRRQAAAAGEPAAILFAADKISKVRQYSAQLAQAGEGGEPLRPRRLHHYVRSLRTVERAIPGHPLVGQLREELARLAPAPVA
jgi:(p)ppGpp synthase/HD superfamily hydrolase